MIQLSQQQLSLLTPTEQLLIQRSSHYVESQSASQLTLSELVAMVTGLNRLYRAGLPAVADHDYDHVFTAELHRRDPQHPFLQTVEPEEDAVFGGKVVNLSQRMLSTDKAYSVDDVKAWTKRLLKAAQEAGIDTDDLVIEITPKLDGFAALDDGDTLCTRGNGYRGTDISRVFERGLSVAGNGERGQGAGEIVINSEYFDEHLVTHFENSRNFQSSIIKEGELDRHTQKAIDAGAALFYPFAALPRWQGSLEALLADFESHVDSVWSSVPFDVDGVVIEAPVLRDIMGHTSHHYRNTIAFKRNEAPVPVKVLSVTYQTGKSGKVTPVAELEPTKISGAVLSRATLHNVGWAENMKVGEGSVALVVRSGLVIPKVVGVEKEGELTLPSHCPSCGAAVVRDGDNLYCSNKVNCSAQVEFTLEYFFKTLGNCDGFGAKTIEKLNQGGINRLEDIYALTESQLIELGFGPGVSANLISELARSRQTPVEDWRFLAAFSLHNVGRGGAERILKAHPLNTVFDLAKQDLMAIDGFADAKADAFLDAMARLTPTIKALIAVGFELIATPQGDVEVDSPIAGKLIVFTGAMTQGSRGDMEKAAKELGAKVGKSVSAKTDYLVTGERVGERKTTDAKSKGVTVINEANYLALLAG